MANKNSFGNTKQKKLEELGAKYGVGGTSGATTPTPANKKTTNKDSAYSNAVKALKSSGVSGAAASSIMTESEWRRRKKSSGYNTYQEYLDSLVGTSDRELAAFNKYAVDKKTDIEGINKNNAMTKAEFRAAPEKSFWEKIVDSVDSFLEEYLPNGSNAAKMYDKSKGYTNKGSWTDDQIAQIAVNALNNTDSIDSRNYAMVNEAYERLSSSYKYKDSDLVAALKEAKKSWQASRGEALGKNVKAAVVGMGADIASFANSLGANKIPGVRQFTNAAVEGGKIAREEAARYNKGKYGESVGNFTQGVVNLVPYFLLGPGKSVADTALKVPKYAKYLAPIVKNPSFWYSLTSMWGGKYQEAIDGGASENAALANAILYAVPSALVEVGGGIGSQDMGTQKLSRTILEEIGEELAQDVIGGMSDKATVNPQLPVWSTEENAIINPLNMAKTALMTAPITAIAGGANKVINKAAISYGKKKNEYKSNKVVDEYKNAVDEKILEFAKSARANKNDNTTKINLQRVSDSAVNDIKNLTGIDVNGYTHSLKANTIHHIDKKHGVNGKTDNSMADDKDLARIQYVLENYDTIEVLPDLSAEYRNKNQEKAPMIKYTKRVNGSYYVVEAVPDTKRHELPIVSAYKNKAVEQRTVDVQASTSNVRNASPGTTLSNNNIPQGSNVVKEDGAALAERLEAQSLNNEPITAEDVKKATVFGDEGSKLVAEIANNDGVTFSQAERAVKTAYMAGFANVETSKVSFETDTQIDAFTAGKKDRTMQDLAAKENAKNATVYDGAFTENEYTKDFSNAEKTMISTVAKSFKMDISAVDKIIANVVEGRIYEADAEHKDGKMQISNNRDANKVLYELVMHESGHRMEQLAPAEFGVLMDALYERAEGRSIRLGVSQGLVLDNVKAQHDNAGITKDTRGYMEEFAVRELETIFGSPEEFNKWYAEISGNQQVKNAWEKFISWLSEVIEDIKKAWSQRNMTAEEKTEAKKVAAELERIKGLLANTYKAAENAAQNRASEVQSESVQKNANYKSDVDFNLKEVESNDNKNTDLTDNDLGEYMKTGKKLHTRNRKQRMLEAGKKPILTSSDEIRGYILDAIHGRARGEVRAFKRVGKSLADAISNKKKSLQTFNKYLELNADDLREAYKMHSYPKEKGDIPLSEQDFERIPEYLDDFDGVISVNTHNNKVEVHIYKKTEDGYMRILTVVSSERNSLQVTKLIGVSKEKFEQKYAKKIEGNIGSLWSLKEDSNPSTTAQHTADVPSTASISSLNEKVKSFSDFSLKGTNNISTKDRKALLDIIEHLKSEFEVTKFTKADPKKLAKMTKVLLKEYNSLAEHDATYKAIDELYQYMANGEEGHPAAWEEVYNRAYDIAQEIVKNALVTDDVMYRQYKSLRNYLRTTPMKFYAGYIDVPSGYESFNDFRKKNMGRLKFTNDGMSIDSVYQELAELYPEFFDTDRDINVSDQLETIVNVLDSIKAIDVNPFDGQIGQTSMYLANDIIDRFFDVPQAKPTFADKAERRVTDAKIAGAKKVEAVRQQRDAKIQKLMEAQREKTKRQLDKMREQRDAKIKQEREKRREAVSKMEEKQKVKVIRAQIMRHTSDLSKKLLRPTDKQHIPQELQSVVAKLLECINLESNYTYDTEGRSYKKNDEGLPTKRTKAFEELRSIYKDIASSVVVDPDLVGEGGLLSDVILLADKRVADMTSSELETVWQTIRAIEASVSTANKMFSQGKFETILEFAEALRKDNASKTEKTELKGVWGKGKKLVTLDMLTPETYLHYLGSSGDSIFRMMRDAQDKHIGIMKEVSDFTHKVLKGVDVNSLEESVHTIKLGGEDVQLSIAQLMELYVLMKREQAVDHIFVGGILPDVTKAKGMKLNAKAEPIRSLTMGEVSDALSKLTDEQKKIADKLQKYVSTVLSEYGNEASMKVYNYEKFLEKNYWPIRANKQEVVSEIGKDAAVTSVANKGMAKGTKPHANTSVRIGSIFDTFSAHSSDMATYAAWLGTSEDVNRIRNFVFWEDGARTGTVKGILDTVHGIHGSEYLQKLLTDIAIGVKGTDNMNPLDNFIGGYKAASVGANLRVVIQQPTAILRALDMIDARYLAEGAVRPLQGWDKAKKYAPIAQWKDWGHFDINTGRQMKDVLFDNASLLEKTKQVGMWGASKADSLSWGLLWNAVEAETKAKHNELEVGSDAYYETVAKRFTEIVDHTQVVDGILQRSQIMRSPDALTKMATSFMGEPTKQYNMAVSAAYDAKNLKGEAQKKAVARLGRTAASLAVAGIINACAQSIIDAMRDDDKEKDYWEKWLASFGVNALDTVNVLNYIPYIKDIVSIMSGYSVTRMDTAALEKVNNAVTNMYKAVTGTGKYTVAEASAQLFAEIGRLYGLPVANVKRDIKSLVMSVAVGTDSCLMQYRIEKAMLDINYAGNSKNFMDILFNAYNNDKEAYEYIYNDMLKSGYKVDSIESGMNNRLMKAEGVTKVSELSKRYMTPANEKKYDSSLKKVKSSNVWKSANASQKKNAEDDLYEFLTSTSEDMKKVRTEAREFGVDETEYTLWQLAIEMADQPKGQEGSGTYDSKEKAEAINSLNLGDKEIAYFFGKGLNETSKEELNETLNAGIDIQAYVNFKAATSEMKADKNANGNSIPNSKKRKVVNYLNNADLTSEEWDYFYYEIMNYKK